MKVYLASKYSAKLQVQKYAKELQKLEIEVTSTWLKEKNPPNTKLSQLEENEALGYALDDIRDINNSDLLVFFSIDPETPVIRGGRHVEFGYALGKGKELLVVGPLENIFHSLPQVDHADTWEEAKTFLLYKKEQYDGI